MSENSLSHSSAGTRSESGDGVAREVAVPLPAGWLSRYPWVTFVLPMAVFMLLTTFEPTPPHNFDPDAAENITELRTQLDRAEKLEAKAGGLLPTFSYQQYPWIYSAKIVLVILTMVAVLPGYRTFPWRVSFLSIVVGVVGVLLWIVLCHLRLEPKIIGPVDRFLGGLIYESEPEQDPSIGLIGMLGTGERSAYNPLLYLSDQPALAWLFLAIRFVGLALVVPVIEEFFLRGFLMRFAVNEKWWQVPFGAVTRAALIVGTAVPILMHPGELFAAFVWFSLVSWLMVRTKSIWDCVVAHGVTNFLLGVYVVMFDQWQLM
jgi:membrane protease YdiL (CAAX protease family)